ncbi:MAG: hypothetical protein ACRETZ_16740 [Steroidobacteraceae bacterium]
MNGSDDTHKTPAALGATSITPHGHRPAVQERYARVEDVVLLLVQVGEDQRIPLTDAERHRRRHAPAAVAHQVSLRNPQGKVSPSVPMSWPSAAVVLVALEGISVSLRRIRVSHG